MVESDVESISRREEENLVSRTRDALVAGRALRAFRTGYRITREPRYPDSHLLHISLVIGMFALESILNSQFFAEASPFGIIGGILQASMISLVNIGLGLFAGAILVPLRNAKKLRDEPLWLINSGINLVAALLLLFNFAAAHYRVLLETLSPDEAVREAIEHLFTQPFSINNFDAWTLLFAGLFFATLAWLDGYKLDDPIREYGALHRDYRNKTDAASKARASIRAVALDTIAQNKNELLDSGHRASILLAEYRSLISRSKAEADYFAEWREQIEDITEALLQRYRALYLEVDEDLNPKPPYFHEPFHFDGQRPFIEEKERWLAAEERAPEIADVVTRIEANREASLQNERQVTAKVNEMIDEFFERVEARARRDADPPLSPEGGSTTPKAPPAQDQ
jgi:hypothetical protein